MNINLRKWYSDIGCIQGFLSGFINVEVYTPIVFRGTVWLNGQIHCTVCQLNYTDKWCRIFQNLGMVVHHLQ